MKGWLFLFTFCIIANFCNAQTVTIIGKKEKTVYAKLPNKTHIKIEGCSCKSLLISTDNGTIRKGEVPCWYYVTPKDLGAGCLFVKAKLKNKIIDVGEILLKVEDVVPVFEIAGKAGGNIRKPVLVSQHFVRAVAYELGCTNLFTMNIDSFTVRIIRGSPVVFYKINIGNEISSETQLAFTDLRINDRVIFFDTKAMGPDLI